MNYAEMSDFEINRCVGLATGEAKVSEPCLKLVIRNSNGKEFNPCKSWADAGPIIEKNKIDINWAIQRGKVRQPYARNGDPEAIGHVGYIHDNPLRAAMVVFLMMQEGK